MVVFGSRKRWDRWHIIPPIGSSFATYTFWGVKNATNPTFYGNQTQLVGGFNPFEKYSSKWESSPSFGVKIKNT